MRRSPGGGGDILGGQGFAGIIGARDFVSPMDYLKDIHGTNLGLGAGAQAAMDAISRQTNDMLGRTAFADIIGPDTFASPLDHLKDFHGPHLGLGLGAGAQAAMDILGTRESMYDMLGQHGADHLRGISSTLNAALAGSSRWGVGDLLGGHATGVADQLRQER